MSITASDARQRLFPLLEAVNDDRIPVEIVSTTGTGYLVSADEHHSLEETVNPLPSPRNAQRLRESVAEARVGRAFLTHSSCEECLHPHCRDDYVSWVENRKTLNRVNRLIREARDPIRGPASPSD